VELWRRTRAEDGGTRTLEENRHQFAALWIIVSHKNGDAFERATDIRWLFSATLCGRLTLVSVCSNYRELHGKRRALSLAGAARGHRSTVSFDKVLHDSRPQTEAAICPRRRSVRLTERFEHQSSAYCPKTPLPPVAMQHGQYASQSLPPMDVAQLLKHMLALALSGYRWARCLPMVRDPVLGRRWCCLPSGSAAHLPSGGRVAS